MRAQLAVLFFLGILPAAAAPASPLTADGLTPFRIGMTEAEIRHLPGSVVQFSSDASGDAEACETAYASDVPGMVIMLVHRRVVVIDADSATTADGVHAGTTEAQLKAIFGKRAVFTDRPYFEGDPHYHWVIVKVQGSREFVFGTSNGVVDSLSVGDRPGVEAMEGCA